MNTLTIECDYSLPLLRLVRCFEEQEEVKVHLRLLLPQGSQRRCLPSRIGGEGQGAGGGGGEEGGGAGGVED